MIKRMNYETESCVFCQASASLLSKSIKNKDKNKLSLHLDKTMKNKLIPSIPNEKWIFQLEAQAISVINWYWEGPKLLVNKTHKKIDDKNVKRENPRATSRACRTSWMKKRLIAPMKGSTIHVNNK